MLTLDRILKVERMLSQTGGREGYRVDNYKITDKSGKTVKINLVYKIDAKTGDLRLVNEN